MTNSKDKVESVIYGTSKQYESEGDSSISRENKKAMTVWRYFNDK